MALLRTFAELKPSMTVLWCYLLWYLVTVTNHFDPSWRLWMNSLGISLLIGTALVLSVGAASLRLAGKWTVFRLYLMPFCVSSFASLIKGQGFLLVLPPTGAERWQSFGVCLAFLTLVGMVKVAARGAIHRPRR